MQSSESQNSVYAPAVIEFITVAARYCLFLEKMEGVNDRSLLENMTKFLPLIYVKAALLPTPESIDEEDEEFEEELPEEVTQADYDYVRQAVWRVLGGDDCYLEVFSPDMQYSEAPITASISEDLADIYQDLKNFVAVCADGVEENMQRALAKVKENFESYWGRKLVCVMRPMHDLMYNRQQS